MKNKDRKLATLKKKKARSKTMKTEIERDAKLNDFR